MKKLRILSLILASALLIGSLCSCSLLGLGGPSYTFTDLGDSYELTNLGDSMETDVVIPDTYKGKPVTSIGARAFARALFIMNQGELETVPPINTITLPDTITKIGQEAFAGSTKLTSVNIPASVTSIGMGAFYQCSSLTSVTIPEGVTEIKESTFDGCSSLTSITVPSTVTKIGPAAFKGCSALDTVALPNGVTEIPAECFMDCGSLTMVNIPANVTAIGEMAFKNCASLQPLTIPTTVLTMGGYVFAGTGEQLTVSVSYDSERPAMWDENWHSGMKGKAVNTSEAYYNNVVVPNQARAEQLQAQIDACLEQYKALNDEIGRLNEASKPYQASGNMEMIRHYRDAMNACKDQQRSIMEQRNQYLEELANCPSTNQLNTPVTDD